MGKSCQWLRGKCLNWVAREGADLCDLHIMLMAQEKAMANNRASKSFDLGGYVEVKDRIIPFHEKYPEGRIETEVIELSADRVTVKASLYEKRDDEAPIATGHSWMNVPGTTTFTRGSEIENTETSAVGRALAFLGIGIEKSIASADEVQGKVADENTEAAAPDPNAATSAQKKMIRAEAERVFGSNSWKQGLLDDYNVTNSANLNQEQAGDIIIDLSSRMSENA